MGENTKPFYIGFDLGGTKMLALVLDHKFNPVGRARKKTKGAEGPEAGLARMLETIEEALQDAHVDRDSVEAIGVGCPGPLNLNKGLVLEAPNLGWHDVELKDFLEKKLKCHAVIANDVDAGTYGEYRFGAGQKGRCVLGVFPGTGIGGGCVYEGKLLRGKTGSCMEIGHIQVQNGGRLCGCGKRGCLETVASRLAIASECATAAFRGLAPNLMKEAGTDLANIRSGALADAIKAGDKVVEDIVRNAAKHLGIGVANAVNLLAPDIIVLGGGLVEALKDLFVDEVSRQVKKRAMSSFVSDLTIVSAKLDDHATALGAAALAADEYNKE